MKRVEYKVTFEPTGRQVHVLPGTIILEAAARAGLILQTPCGGVGTCGKCRVRIMFGTAQPSDECRAIFTASELAAGCRLACHTRVTGESVVEIPATSLFEFRQQILVNDAGVGATADLQPAVAKYHVKLPPPDQTDALSDVERLRAALRPARFDHVSIHTLRALGGQLRKNDFDGTAVIVDRELMGFEPADTTRQVYGLAFDVGTTTLVGTLVDLVTGTDLAVEAALNPQTSYGDDVITRIRRCREDREGLALLQRVLIGALNTMIDELVRVSGVNRSMIYEIVLAGNTTMQQILCGIDPSALGELPFVPAFTEALRMRAEDINLNLNRTCRVYVFPQIGGFVGGDTVAGLVASHLDEESGPVLLVDIGTNGEIVLAHNGVMIATSVAAGPAFEGARISCGMRATSGAIEKVLIDGDLEINVIGNVRPAGLCGSGLIDAVAELLRVGVLDVTGRIQHPTELGPDVPPAIRSRLVERNGQVDFVLATDAEAASGDPIYLCQRDIRELQLANAAIRSGINILLQMQGLTPSDIRGILLAGGFGNFIRRNHARRMGLLPPIPCNRIRYIGNASSLGAKRALLSVTEKQYASGIAARVRHVDLSLSPEFQMEFGNAMIFPDGDAAACDDV